MRSTVYDDYFPIGTAPSGDCQVHGAASMIGISGAAEASGTSATAGTAGTVAAPGIMAASYASAPATHLEKVLRPDGREVWVARQ